MDYQIQHHQVTLTKNLRGQSLATKLLQIIIIIIIIIIMLYSD